jgi:hypothetical protein
MLNDETDIAGAAEIVLVSQAFERKAISTITVTILYENINKKIS